MKARSHEDISIVSRNGEESRAKTEARPGGAPSRRVEKPRFSLASKISSAYYRMFIMWLAIILIFIVLLVGSLRVIFIVSTMRPLVNDITSDKQLYSMTAAVKEHTEKLVLVNEDLEVLAAAFPKNSVKNRALFHFETIDKHVYLALANNIDATGGQRVTLLYYHDISNSLFELIVLGASGLILFVIAISFVLIKGNLVTKRAFGVIDELIGKANNISSQNLNLRLNVSDSTDELIEFAITFNKMMDRIEKAYEKQNQFVSDASHELRTPISVIQGYARMLERWGMDDREILKESIDAINKESRSMQDLVDKLLFIARNDKDTLLLVKETFDMSELMNELSRETKMLEMGHEIRSYIEPGLSIYGDRNRIKQALRIFIDNALKYTDKEGVITLRLDIEDGQAIAVIKDTGMGIPEKDLPNIFDRFYRVDTARERNKGGHGLGLSIARIIVLRHGGRIKVASKMGEGTRFSVCLPFQHNTEQVEREYESMAKISPDN